jgi:hypothetical protein
MLTQWGVDAKALRQLLDRNRQKTVHLERLRSRPESTSQFRWHATPSSQPDWELDTERL